MRKTLIASCFVLACTFMATAAMAENIGGRLGVTGRLGFIVPADSEALLPNGGTANVSTDTGFIGGGGLIYGLTNNIALDLDVTYATYGSKSGDDFNTTNVSLGASYRFTKVPIRHLVPFVGAGMDILMNGIDNSDADVDTVVGVHIKGGADYYFTKDFAATAELKGVLAPDADITFRGTKVGNFDPMSFSMTFGVKYFFNL